MADKSAAGIRPSRVGNPPPGARPPAGHRGDGQAPASQTLDRGLRVLEALAGSQGPLTTVQLAEALGVHRSIVYRILRTLEDHRLVSRRPDGGYEPGLGLSALAGAVARSLQSAALPELSELANALGMTAFLVVAEGSEAVTLVSVEPRRAAAHVAYRPGLRHPLDRGAPGLALLAGGPPLPGERPEVGAARTAGFARSRGEVLPGMSSVASPVLSPTGGVVAAVAVVFVADATPPRPDAAGEAALAHRVVAAARAVAARLI